MAIWLGNVRRSVLGMSIAFGTVLGGCPLDKAAETTAQQCPAEETPPPRIHVTFEASVLDPASDRVLATISAGSISGGGFTRNWSPPPEGQKQATNFAILIGTVSLLDGQVTKGADQLQNWRDATVAATTACDNDPKCDAVATWQKAGAQRDVMISAKTEDGTEIAQWRFNGAFPTDLTLADEGKLGSLRFASDEAGFRTLDVTSLPGTMPAMEAKLSKADAGITDESVAQFGLRYLPPEGFLSALNHNADGKAVFVEASLGRCEGDKGAAIEACVITAREVGSGMATGRRLSMTPTTPSQTRNVHQGDYLPAHNFKIEIDGAVAGTFKEVDGLDAIAEVVEYRNGDDPITHKRAGKTKYKNIVLKRGLEGDAPMLEWYKKVVAGSTDRKSGSIIYLDREGNETLRYNFFEAWPTRWSAPELNSSSDTHIVQELEFTVDKVERATAATP